MCLPSAGAHVDFNFVANYALHVVQALFVHAHAKVTLPNASNM